MAILKAVLTRSNSSWSEYKELMRCRGLRKLLAWVSCPKENGDEGESARGWSSSLEGCSGQLHVTALAQSLCNPNFNIPLNILSTTTITTASVSLLTQKMPVGLHVNILIRNFVGQNMRCVYVLLMFSWKL